MMSKEKQIEEMVKDIPSRIVAYNSDPKGAHLYIEQRKCVAEAFYNAGYRKQSEGEWIIKKGGYYQRLVCSVCEKLSIATFDYCPNCGAKMKGGKR